MAPLKIAFMSNQLDNRGTGNALFNYAHYNETILGNESLIFTLYRGNHDDEAVSRFKRRFEVNFVEEQKYFRGFDALYHIKSGANDGFDVSVPYWVHAVFDNDPHGTVYATISPWMGQRFRLPVVPHIVETSPWITTDLRDELDIPKDAVVFGRHGGADSFDINFVHYAIGEYVRRKHSPEVYFLLMNTDRFDRHPNIIHIPATVNPISKQEFINTCDAMIHARSRGETFGIAVGEFAINNKPIITYSESHEKAHLQELGHFALTYDSAPTVIEQFDKVVRGPLISWGYGQYTPENVMAKFKEVFIDANNPATG